MLSSCNKVGEANRLATYRLHVTTDDNKLVATCYEQSVCTVYNMSGRVVSDIQTRAEGESLYIRYNTDANVVNDLKNDSSYEFIGEVILKINVVKAEKIKV